MTSNRKKKLKLHIGRPKTGSSALQYFLWNNRETLREHGILYPQSVMHHRASHKLALAFQPDLPGHQLVAEQSIKQIYEMLSDEAEHTGSETIVASSENLYLVDPRQVAACMPADMDVEILCYVRRQDHVLASSFVQEVKTGDTGFDTPVREYAFHEERLHWLDYERVLDEWADAFGSGRVKALVYPDDDPEWSIFRDFSQVAGLPYGAMTAPVQRINPSPSRDVLDFIRMINHREDLKPFKHAALRVPLMSASEKLGTGGGYDAKAAFDPGLRHEIVKRFARSNERVAEKYGVCAPSSLFSTNVPDADVDGDCYQGFDLERFAYMMATLCGAMQAEIDELRREVKQLSS